MRLSAANDMATSGGHREIGGFGVREVRGEMVQVELFWSRALVKTANHKAHVRLHLLSSSAAAERQICMLFSRRTSKLCSPYARNQSSLGYYRIDGVARTAQSTMIVKIRQGLVFCDHEKRRTQRILV